MAASRRNDAPPPRDGRARCPICRSPVGPAGASSPFCSPRCELIDLGRWLGGDYRIEIPAEATDRDVSTAEPRDGFPDSEGAP